MEAEDPAWNLIIMMMITLEGAIRDLFYNLLTVSNTYALAARAITCNTSGAHHVQHVVCHVLQGTAQLLRLTELKSQLFCLYLIGGND